MIVESLVSIDNSYEVFGKWYAGGRGWDNTSQEDQALIYHPYISPVKGIDIISYDAPAPDGSNTAYHIEQKLSISGWEDHYMCDIYYTGVTATSQSPPSLPHVVWAHWVTTPCSSVSQPVFMQPGSHSPSPAI